MLKTRLMTKLKTSMIHPFLETVTTSAPVLDPNAMTLNAEGRSFGIAVTSRSFTMDTKSKVRTIDAKGR